MKQYIFSFSLLLGFFLPGNTNAQVGFIKVTDPANAITQHPAIQAYTGVSWIDFDSDGDLDLFVNSGNLYQNDGNGNFSKVDAQWGFGSSVGLGNGNTWADIDNDGDLDVFRTTHTSELFRHTGSSFEKENEGDISNPNIQGWAGAWGDYDNDGFVDLVVTHPAGFLPTSQENFLFHNNGDGRFTRITAGDVVTGQAAYTICSWSDFDQDGDQDLFIGSGEVSFQSRDHIYINQLKETGTADLVRLDTGAIATDLRDGQNWNWIDYDNDGDLDGFVTNYFGAIPNDLYRNDNGQLIKMTTNEVGDIVAHNGAGLTNIWEDFDNDGDIDCFVTFDGGLDRFYSNNGDGTFTEFQLAMYVNGPTRGASAGDYDGNGFLDIFVSSASAATVGLYRNAGNANHWLHINCIGNVSNKSAIGARLRAKATINGNTYWQMREISAQNSFCGMNSLTVEFGLGDAMTVDSLIVEWPSGEVSYQTNIAADQVIEITEDIPLDYLSANFTAEEIVVANGSPAQFRDLTIADPNSSLTYEWDFDLDGNVDATSTDPTFVYPDSGTYSVRLVVSSASKSDTITRNDYVRVEGATSIEENLATPLLSFLLAPNPFTDSVELQYELSQKAKVGIQITMLSGREIYKADLGKKKAGAHEWHWNGQTLQNKAAPAGVYIFNLLLENEAQAWQKGIKR